MHFLPTIQTLKTDLWDTIILQKFYIFEWAVTLFAIGIAIYFALPIEPSLWIALSGGTLGAALALWSACRRKYWVLAFFLGSLLLGFTNGYIHTHRLMPEHLWTTSELAQIKALDGTILSLEHRSHKLRLKIALDFGEPPRDIPPESNILPAQPSPPPQFQNTHTLRVVRISVPEGAEPLAIYDQIHLDDVTLKPPSKPLVPGGYDFARHCFFDGIDAVGFGEKAPIFKGHHPSQGLSAAKEFLESMRDKIREALEVHLPPQTAGIAKALIIGDKGGITKATQRLFSEVGIAHILAISGLHFSLVTAFLFIGIRLALVAIPGMAERYPIKQWAGAIALIGAAIYLFLSGMAIPTLRAFIMISCVMVGLFLYRQTISLRLVMIAALLILLPMPEALLSPSFELSFAAVIALISAYNSYLGFRDAQHGFKRVLKYTFGLIYTSAIAWIATTPIALSFFQVLSPYALIANLWVVPWIGCVVMPLALISVLAMPLGWDAPLLWLFDISLQLLLRGTEWMHTWPGSSTHTSAPPSIFLVCWIVGGMWICLFQGRGRWLGVLPILFGIGLWGTHQMPDFYLEQDPAMMALRHPCAHTAEGKTCLSFPRKAYGGFVQTLWQDHSGAAQIHLWPYPPRNTAPAPEPETVPEPVPTGMPLTCNTLGCTLQKDKLSLSFPRSCRTLKRYLREDAETHPRTLWVNRWADCDVPPHPQVFSMFKEGEPIGPGVGTLTAKNDGATLIFQKTQTQKRPWIHDT